MILLAELHEVYPYAGSRAERFYDALMEAMGEFEIDNAARVAAFLAQVGVESGELKYVNELWGPTGWQVKYERDPEAAWPPTTQDRRNRKAWDLGNSEEGDGRRFSGWGLIQTTGRKNTLRASQALYDDGRLCEVPTLIHPPDEQLAARSAGLYWADNKLNELADENTTESFRMLTKRINGASTDNEPSHHLRRVAYWLRAKNVLGVA